MKPETQSNWNVIMAIIRLILGKLILLFNWVFTPKSVTRDPAEQAVIDDQTSQLTLYQYEACPFCVKVRRAIKRHGLHIETRDVKRSEAAKGELLAGGGDLKVPCLKIEDSAGAATWMHDSKDIISYLQGRFVAG